MAKSKKKKIHKKIDGQLLQMNKKFSNLKVKQKDKITGWVYEEYKKYVTEHDKTPDSLADAQIVEAVLDKINEAQIWIPDAEIYDYYRRKKPQLQKRLDNEKVIKFKSYVSFYKSIVDQDRASIVICKCIKAPHDQHYDENNFYNKKGYKEVMENFSREKNYYKDSLIVKHHKLKYSSKMPLWVIVEFSKKSLIQTVETVIDEYRDDIDLNLIGFPENYLEIMKNNL